MFSVSTTSLHTPLSPEDRTVPVTARGETRGNHTYQYRIRENGTSTWGSWRSLPSNNTIQNLGETTTYDIQLRRQRTFSTCTDWSDPTTTVYCTTLSCTGTTPTAPQAPQTTSGNQKCQVQRSSSDSSSYIYQYSHNDTAWKEGTGASDLTLFSNLTNDTTYPFRARRKASNNNRACWSPVSTTTDCTPSDCAPSTPGAPQWSAGSGTCTLTPNSSDTTAGYTYQYSRTNSNQGWQTANSSHSKTFTGLHVGTHTFTTRRLHNDNSCLDPSPQSSTATCTVTVGSSPSSYSPSGYSPSSPTGYAPTAYAPASYIQCAWGNSYTTITVTGDDSYCFKNTQPNSYFGEDEAVDCVRDGNNCNAVYRGEATNPCTYSCTDRRTIECTDPIDGVCPEGCLIINYRENDECYGQRCSLPSDGVCPDSFCEFVENGDSGYCGNVVDCEDPVDGVCPEGCDTLSANPGVCKRYEHDITIEYNGCKTNYVAECASDNVSCAAGTLNTTVFSECNDDDTALVTTTSYVCEQDQYCYWDEEEQERVCDHDSDCFFDDCGDAESAEVCDHGCYNNPSSDDWCKECANNDHCDDECESPDPYGWCSKKGVCKCRNCDSNADCPDSACSGSTPYGQCSWTGCRCRGCLNDSHCSGVTCGESQSPECNGFECECVDDVIGP